MESVLLAAGSDFKQILMCASVSVSWLSNERRDTRHSSPVFQPFLEQFQYFIRATSNHSFMLALLKNTESVAGFGSVTGVRWTH